MVVLLWSCGACRACGGSISKWKKNSIMDFGSCNTSWIYARHICKRIISNKRTNYSNIDEILCQKFITIFSHLK